MIEMVFALLLIVDHKIVEHRYHESLSNCLKAKRYAMKDKSTKDRVVYKCIQSKANVEVYFEHPVGIGEHSDITGAIGEELDKIARYHDQIEVLKNYF